MKDRALLLYANDENIGDFLSAQGIARLTSDRVRHFPFERRTPALRSALASLNHQSTVIVGGGGLLKASFDGFWRIMREALTVSKFRLIIWGVGYCDVVGEDARGSLKLLRDVVRNAEASAFRDPASYAPFADLPNTRIIGCPALHAVRLLEPTSVPYQKGGTLLRVDHPDLLAGISRQRQMDVQGRLDEICREWAYVQGLHINITTNLVPRVGSVPDAVRARMSPTPWETGLAMRKVAKLVRSRYVPADIVLTSRLHGAIIAAALGKRIVALSHDSKIEQFMNSIGLSDFVTDDPEKILDLLDAVPDQTCLQERVDDLIAQNVDFAQQYKSSPV